MLLLTGGMLLLAGGRGGMLLLLEERGVLLVVGYLLLNTELLGVPGLGTGPGGPVLRGGPWLGMGGPL